MDERPVGEGRGSKELSRQQRRAAARTRRKRETRGGAVAEKALASGAALALGAGLGLAAPAEAATFNVTNLNDSGTGSLRQAISDANAAAGADAITFQAGLTGTITLTSGQLVVTDSVDVQGPGQAVITVDGNNATRIFYLYNNSALLDVTISGLTLEHGNDDGGAGIVDFGENLTLDHVTVQNNTSSGEGGQGGGVALLQGSGSLTVLNSTVSGNQADKGGGIYVEDSGAPVLIQDSVISGNQTTGRGAGIYLYHPSYNVTIERSTIANNTAGGNGGGIYLYTMGGGAFTLRQTTISGNTAANGGGAFFYQADYSPDAPLFIENSTISGNHATAGNGGGLFFESLNGAAILRNSTVADNDATGTGGGVYLYLYRDTLTVQNSIIAGNTASESNDLGGAGTFDLSYTLVQDPSANILNEGGNLLGQDPLLGPLANNGGPTQTQRPAANSPAVNAGDPAFGPPPSTDQRGFPRVVNGRLDMGAVELNPGTIQLTTSAASVGEGAGTITITVTRTGGADGAVSVSYATANGTATAPADYGAAAGTLNWADGDTAPKTFMVTIVDDATPEPDETFSVSLSGPQGGAVLGSPATETVTIVDNDPPVAVVPTLGEMGKAALAGLLALGGLLLMRRRKGLAAPVVALTLTLGTLGRVAAADAKGTAPRPMDQKAGTLAQTQTSGTTATLRLADGTTLTVPLGKVEIKDHRRHHHAADALPGLAALPAGQPVVVKVKHGADGAIRRVKVQIFDTQQAAQAAVQRKHRRPS